MQNEISKILHLVGSKLANKTPCRVRQACLSKLDKGCCFVLLCEATTQPRVRQGRLFSSVSSDTSPNMHTISEFACGLKRTRLFSNYVNKNE